MGVTLVLEEMRFLDSLQRYIDLRQKVVGLEGPRLLARYLHHTSVPSPTILMELYNKSLNVMTSFTSESASSFSFEV